MATSTPAAALRVEPMDATVLAESCCKADGGAADIDLVRVRAANNIDLAVLVVGHRLCGFLRF